MDSEKEQANSMYFIDRYLKTSVKKNTEELEFCLSKFIKWKYMKSLFGEKS